MEFVLNYKAQSKWPGVLKIVLFIFIFIKPALAETSDHAYSLAVDAQGNVFVTGTSFFGLPPEGSISIDTIKYSPDGEMIWLDRYPQDLTSGTSMTFDSEQNPVVVLCSDFGFVKYDRNGNRILYSNYEFEELEWAYEISIDNDENIIISGHRYVYIPGVIDPIHDLLIVKFRRDGESVWSKHFTGPHVSDSGHLGSLTVDTLGNVYITGWTSGQMGVSYHGFVIKYDPDGNRLWREYWDSDLSMAFNDMAVDYLGNVYVTGHYNNYSWITLKYDSDGNHLWEIYYEGKQETKAFDLALDEQGNIYVVGSVAADDEYSESFLTVKYDSNGNEVWSAINSFKDYPGRDGFGTLITLDDYADVYVAGISSIANQSSDYTLIKYNSDGEEQWMTVSSRNDKLEFPYSLVVDDLGFIYLTGYIVDELDNGKNDDYLTVKYDNDGNEIWSVRYDSEPPEQDEEQEDADSGCCG